MQLVMWCLIVSRVTASSGNAALTHPCVSTLYTMRTLQPAVTILTQQLAACPSCRAAFQVCDESRS